MAAPKILFAAPKLKAPFPVNFFTQAPSFQTYQTKKNCPVLMDFYYCLFSLFYFLVFSLASSEARPTWSQTTRLDLGLPVPESVPFPHKRKQTSSLGISREIDWKERLMLVLTCYSSKWFGVFFFFVPLGYGWRGREIYIKKGAYTLGNRKLYLSIAKNNLNVHPSERA